MNETSSSGLVIGVDSVTATRLLPALRRAGLEPLRMSWASTVMDLIPSSSFKVIVTGFPLTKPPFSTLLSAVRGEHSRCLNASLLVLASPGFVDDASDLIGQGVNRVLPVASAEGELLAALSDLLQVAPRVPLRAPARLELRPRSVRAFCQTVNLSVSGMLLRCAGHYPVGTEFAFEVRLPDISPPIRGAAKITRATNPQREHIVGFGARFVGFEDADLMRLENFLSSCLH